MDIGADDISDVVVSLGDILKYSIHGKDVLVPLNEEVQYIESYLCIQKNRLEAVSYTHLQKELQKELGNSLRTIKRMIAELQDKGYIVRRGNNRSGEWIVKG